MNSCSYRKALLGVPWPLSAGTLPLVGQEAVTSVHGAGCTHTTSIPPSEALPQCLTSSLDWDLGQGLQEVNGGKEQGFTGERSSWPRWPGFVLERWCWWEVGGIGASYSICPHLPVPPALGLARMTRTGASSMVFWLLVPRRQEPENSGCSILLTSLGPNPVSPPATRNFLSLLLPGSLHSPSSCNCTHSSKEGNCCAGVPHHPLISLNLLTQVCLVSNHLLSSLWTS